MIIGKFDSATITNKIRLLKAVIFGRLEVRGNIIECLPYGIDSSPIQNIKVIYSDTARTGYPIIIGVQNTNQKAAPGELRTFATDINGAEKGYTWLKTDGTYEVLGNDDNMVRYSKLETAFNTMKNDLDGFMDKWNSFCSSYVPGSPTVTGLPATLSSSAVTHTAADITPAKITRIKTIGSDS